MIVVPLLSLRHKLAEYETQKNGQIINAMITRVPDCQGEEVGFMEFRYQGQRYSKEVSCSFSDRHKRGDTIRMKHLAKTGIFLLEQEHKEGELVAIGILPIVGVISVIFSLKAPFGKKQKKHHYFGRSST